MFNVLEKIIDFEKYLYEEEKSKNTIEKYLRDLKELKNWLEKNSNGEIIKENLLAFKEYLKTKHKSKISSINSKISSLNSFFVFIERKELILKTIKYQKNLFGLKEKELTIADLDKLLKVSKKNEKLNCLIETIVSTGIRVSEVKYITIECLETGWVKVDNKGKIRIIRLSNNLCKKLKKYCKKYRIFNGSVFITRNGKPFHRTYIWSILKSLCKNANVDSKKVYPHNLRHLFAREFYKQTKDIVKLASILGHSSIETTKIYTLESEDRIIEIIENLNIVKMIC